jgi:hypothetical protein
MRLSWSRDEVDDRLHKIMISIHGSCHETAERYGTPTNLVNGANIAGFLKVANAMMDQGGSVETDGRYRAEWRLAPNDIGYRPSRSSHQTNSPSA